MKFESEHGEAIAWACIFQFRGIKLQECWLSNARSDYLRCIGKEDLRRDLIARSWHLNFFSEELHFFGFKVRRFWKFVEV